MTAAEPRGPARGVPAPTDSGGVSRVAVPTISASQQGGFPGSRDHLTATVPSASLGDLVRRGKQTLDDRFIQHTPWAPQAFGHLKVITSASFYICDLVNKPLPLSTQNSAQWAQANLSG